MARRRWETYTKAKDRMLKRTHIPEAPWWIVEGDNKKRARLNCMRHLLEQIAYGEVEREQVKLPARERQPGYERQHQPKKMFVPAIY